MVHSNFGANFGANLGASVESNAAAEASAISLGLRKTSNKPVVQLELLSELSAKLQSLVDSDNFYSEVVNLVQKKFNYYGIHIWTVVDSSGVPSPMATLRAHSGVYQDYLKIGQTMLRDAGITGQVIQTKKAAIVNDVSKNPHFTSLSIPVNTKSQLSVPVIKDDIVVAVMGIESDELNAFGQDDVLTATTVASQIAVASQNQRLFQETKEFSRKLQTAVDEKTNELRQAQERILEQQRLLQKENKALKTLVNHESKANDVVGQSQAILSLMTMVDKIAPTTATVLVQGESGTGKELVARRLHVKSERSNRPYVTVNCGALQESLLESELFGHEKGSFTGAVNQKIGLCETADGGTLFLDEIGEMSIGIQSKLLRFLQEGEFYRIGGKRPIKVDVRVVSATNRDLEKEVKESRFREDLFYRLNTITLRVPPLRKRSEDIPLLVDFFLKSSRFGGNAAQIRWIDPRVIEVFKNYDWPGNIRELQNTLERLKILADNQEIRLEDIPYGIRMPVSKVGKSDSSELPVEMSLEEVEKNHIVRTLAFHNGNKTRSAHSLGITIKTLYNKLHRYGLVKTAEAEVSGVNSTNSAAG